MSGTIVSGVDDGPEPLPEVPYLPTLLDADVAPDDVAAWAAGVTPGSATVKPLAVLDPGRLSHGGRVDALTALEKHISWLQALQHKLLAVMAADPVVPTPMGEVDKQWTREDVACALRLSANTAADRLALATELTRLPDRLDLLHRGGTSNLHVRHLADATVGLDDSTATTLEAEVLEKAEVQSVATFRRSVKKAVLSIAPKAAEERHADAVKQRRVVRTAVNDGMSEIWMLLPDPGAATFMTAVDALARNRQSGDDRTADQCRADAAVQLALNTLHGTNSGDLPREHGMCPAVQVTVALSTLLGLDEQPGDLDGTGAIPASLARRIAADETGTWRRLVTDPMGRLLDYGRSTYRPPGGLADFVIARDRTCRSPHCNRNAKRCELDHERAWSEGGDTNADSLNSLCPRHHHGRHDADWIPRRLPNGDVEWTSPTGHTYVDPPATYPIDRTAEPDPPNELSPTEASPTETDPPPF